MAYAGYYPAGKRGYEDPTFSFDRADPTGLFYPINQYLDRLWQVSAPLTVEDLK